MSRSIDRHPRLRAVFDELLPMDPSAREAYLELTCADDPELRVRVLRLLAAHDEARSFLEHPLDFALSDQGEEPFRGTDRFHVRRRIGSGGMGVVYEVDDQLRGEIVALKTLRRSGAADLYRLKREFRALADVTHPNLVCLYELFVDDQQSFFTMELVDGVNFVEYVRGADGAGLSAERLISSIHQVAEGVSALHRRDQLHRDLKPSNVLVTSDGRVVILDFGLIAEIRPPQASAVQHVRGGTPAYMSPEEASGAAPAESSDWYGVGVTLYEALTGRLPFEGSIRDVLHVKQTTDPPSPAEIAPHQAPDRLSALCMRLLSRDPVTRLSAAAGLHQLADDTELAALSRPSTMQETPFVGRQRQLAALQEARDTASKGQPTIVAISGPSGMGKSALVRRFLVQLGDRPDCVVLTGRCYENESVPYKALDGVVDDLSRYLASLTWDQAAGLLPPGVSALTRVFPVLRQVAAVADACRQNELESVDPLRAQRMAFESLGTLLGTLASGRTLVVWIDDLQWADADSMVLLEALLDAPHPPAMAMLLCFRSEEIAAKPFLQAVRDRAGRDGSVLTLEPMTDEEAVRMIAGLHPDDSTLSDSGRRRIASEAGGSPFVLEQLALHVGVAPEGSHSTTFAAMFDSRIDTLAPGARPFLDVLALCGRPMSPEIICDACEIARDRQSLVARLRASRLIRSSGSSALVETYHDRIREVLADRLEPTFVRHLHARIAGSLVARGSDDCEALFEHYRGAGEAGLAAIQAAIAAAKASNALAFDRAATFYRHALLLASASPSTQQWREALATALANAGRPAEAAEEYLLAAADAEHARQVELHRRAAEQLLTGGHIDRGFDLIRRVLESVGLSSPNGPRTALVWLLWRRARLSWRGRGYTLRSAHEIDANLLLQLDTCWAAATGLALVDVVSASDFLARYLHMALDAGEPLRIIRGLALESSARNTGWPFRSGSAALIAEATSLAHIVGTPQAIAMTHLADSITACVTGQWKRALASAEEALTILRDRCVGVTWELTIAQNMAIWALMYLGELGDVSRRVPALLADARRRGNLYLATELCTRSNYVWLIADNPNEGEREAADALARWSQKGFHRQHYSAMLARVQTALYRGEGETAWRLLAEQESNLRRSMLLRVQVIRIEWLYLRGRSAVAIAATTKSGRFLSIARASARRIARERMPWSTPIARLVEAGIASVEGRYPLAETCLSDAVEQFEAADMKLYAAVSRLRLGALRDDERGRELRRETEAWMASQRIQNPAYLTRMLAPGFPD